MPRHPAPSHPGREPSLRPCVHSAHAPHASVTEQPPGPADRAVALLVLLNGLKGSWKPLPKVKGGVWGNTSRVQVSTGGSRWTPAPAPRLRRAAVLAFPRVMENSGRAPGMHRGPAAALSQQQQQHLTPPLSPSSSPLIQVKVASSENITAHCFRF